MFSHLDDPQPETATAGWRASVRHRVRRRQRRRAGAVVGGLATVTAVAVGAGAVVDRRLEPERVAVEGLAERPDEAGRTFPAEQRRSGEPVTVLFVGVDGSGDLGAGDRPLGGLGHSDTIVLARIDPGRGQVRLLPVPRDLWVPIADAGTDQRINVALEAGGPSRLVRTIRDQLGIEVHHYVQADLDGARSIVDALGGLRLSVPHRVTSERTGLALDPGCQVLDGAEVLALGRARDVRIHDPVVSRPRVDDSADLGRQDRAAVVVAALLQAVGEVGPADLPGLVDAGLRDLVVDHGVTRQEVLSLGRTAAAAEVVTYRLPVIAADRGEQRVLLPAAGVLPLAQAFVDGTPAPTPPKVGPDASEPAIVTAGDATGLAVC